MLKSFFSPENVKYINKELICRMVMGGHHHIINHQIIISANVCVWTVSETVNLPLILKGKFMSEPIKYLQCASVESVSYISRHRLFSFFYLIRV